MFATKSISQRKISTKPTKKVRRSHKITLVEKSLKKPQPRSILKKPQELPLNKKPTKVKFLQTVSVIIYAVNGDKFIIKPTPLLTDVEQQAKNDHYRQQEKVFSAELKQLFGSSSKNENQKCRATNKKV